MVHILLPFASDCSCEQISPYAEVQELEILIQELYTAISSIKLQNFNIYNIVLPDSLLFYSLSQIYTVKHITHAFIELHIRSQSLIYPWVQCDCVDVQYVIGKVWEVLAYLA